MNSTRRFVTRIALCALVALFLVLFVRHVHAQRLTPPSGSTGTGATGGVSTGSTTTTGASGTFTNMNATVLNGLVTVASNGTAGTGTGLPTISSATNAQWLTNNGVVASWTNAPSSGSITVDNTGLCYGVGCPGGTAGVLGLLTAVIPRVGSVNIFTGRQEFDQATDLLQLSTAPAVPAVGKLAVYADNSGNLHTLTPAGVNTTLGSSSGGGSGSSLYAATSQVTLFDLSTCPTGTTQTIASFTIPSSTLTIGSQTRLKFEFQQATATNYQGAYPAPKVVFGTTGGVAIFTNLSGLNSPGNMQRGEADFATFSTASEITNAFQSNGAGANSLSGSSIANATDSTSSAIPVTLQMSCSTPSATMSGQIYVHTSLEVGK
jgi:hypothetical protein